MRPLVPRLSRVKAGCVLAALLLSMLLLVLSATALEGKPGRVPTGPTLSVQP